MKTNLRLNATLLKQPFGRYEVLLHLDCHCPFRLDESVNKSIRLTQLLLTRDLNVAECCSFFHIIDGVEPQSIHPGMSG